MGDVERAAAGFWAALDRLDATLEDATRPDATRPDATRADAGLAEAVSPSEAGAPTPSAVGAAAEDRSADLARIAALEAEVAALEAARAADLALRREALETVDGAISALEAALPDPADGDGAASS